MTRARAVAHRVTLVETDPADVTAMGVLGRMLYGGGYHDEAIDQLRRAMRASPHDPLTWNWNSFLGTCQFNSRDFRFSAGDLP